MPPVTEQTRVVRLLRGAVAIKLVREEDGLSHKQFGRKVGVSHVTVLSWEKGESVPRETDRAAIETACAVLDPLTEKPVVNHDTGRVVSRCPREFWEPMVAAAADQAVAS